MRGRGFEPPILSRHWFLRPVCIPNSSTHAFRKELLMPLVIKALVSGGLSAQRPVSEIASLTVAGFLFNPKVRHHFGRATSATLFLTQAWNSSCCVTNVASFGQQPPPIHYFIQAWDLFLFFGTRGDLNRPLVLCASRTSPVFPLNFYRSIIKREIGVEPSVIHFTDSNSRPTCLGFPYLHLHYSIRILICQ